jgi:hypothetical protein
MVLKDDKEMNPWWFFKLIFLLIHRILTLILAAGGVYDFQYFEDA